MILIIAINRMIEFAKDTNNNIFLKKCWLTCSWLKIIKLTREISDTEAGMTSSLLGSTSCDSPHGRE